jgi:hypothetical protein
MPLSGGAGLLLIRTETGRYVALDDKGAVLAGEVETFEALLADLGYWPV